MAQTAWPAQGAIERPTINRIDFSDLSGALRLGWRDFLAAPTQLFFLCLVYPLLGLVLAREAAGNALLPLLWPMLAGFALLGPVVALGLYEMSRRRELGFAVTWRDMLGVLRAPALGGILALALALFVAFAVWLGVAGWLYHTIMGHGVPVSLRAMLGEIVGTRQGWVLMVLGNLTGAFFALCVLAASLVSFPMMLDRELSAGEAVQASLAAFIANPLVLTAWGVIVGTLLLGGMALLGVGLAVVLPVLGHATWHLYRRLVV